MPLEKSIRTGLSLSGILDVYETNQVDTGLLPFAGFLGRMDVHSHFHLHHPNEKINDRSIFQDELLTQLVIPCEKDKVKFQQQETHLDVCVLLLFIVYFFLSFLVVWFMANGFGWQSEFHITMSTSKQLLQNCCVERCQTQTRFNVLDSHSISIIASLTTR